MDFTLGAELAEVTALAARIFTDRAQPSLVRRAEEAGGFDAELWRTLGEADLIGLALPQDAGGSGLGMLGLVAVLEQQGRRVAPVPMWSTVTQGALPLAEFGSATQKKRWLPGVVDGRFVITGSFDPDALTAESDGDDLVVTGELAAVPAGPVARACVVPVTTGDGMRVAVVPTDRSGLGVTPLTVTSRESFARLVFDGVRLTGSDLLPADGGTVIDRVRTRARIALAALATGVCQEAVAITAEYTSQRRQFGRPLSTNQAVALRAADAHLDTERIRLTACKAAWHADRGEEDQARAASLVAKWWASTGGLRAVHATQHLHGGIGADVDYPIHRYFLWGRQIAFTLGSAGAVEAELGGLLDSVTPIGALA
ncbi:acyl-CoA dehydrogenase family protein [Streptomyces mirabilis]|uniref:acyl-CoA dehydrogenase family protein n=1 Tax=Streptomyces mirabilis TaxID=68239 RepID=UPI0033A707D7